MVVYVCAMTNMIEQSMRSGSIGYLYHYCSNLFIFQSV